jgi:MFS family permease
MNALTFFAAVAAASTKPLLVPMIHDAHVVEITQVIQLAIAPVFLLTSVGTFIAVLSNRLGRAVDRIRYLEEKLHVISGERAQDTHRELQVLARRMRLIYISIGLSVISAILVALIIALAFIDAFIEADLSRLIGVLFIIAMAALIGALMIFLREVFVAITRTRATLGRDADEGESQPGSDQP